MRGIVSPQLSQFPVSLPLAVLYAVNSIEHLGQSKMALVLSAMFSLDAVTKACMAGGTSLSVFAIIVSNRVTHHSLESPFGLPIGQNRNLFSCSRTKAWRSGVSDSLSNSTRSRKSRSPLAQSYFGSNWTGRRAGTVQVSLFRISGY